MDWYFFPPFSFMNSAMMSAFGLRPGSVSGLSVFPNVCPSRLKMRRSRPAASATRATIGTSRRQSDDQSSERARIFAGPPG